MSRFASVSRWLLGLIPVLVLGTGCTGKYKDLLAERDNQIQALKSEKAALEGDVEKLRGNEEVIQRQVAAERSRADGLQQHVGRLQRDVQKIPAGAGKGGGGDEEAELAKAMGDSGSVRRRKEGIALVLPAAVTFTAGSAELTRTGQSSLRKVAQIVKSRYRSRSLSIDGHTDAQPVKHSKFGTNWRLSTERALAVAQFLERTCGMDPRHLRVVGHSQYQPVASNKEPAGMQQNRRVEVVILN